MTLASLSAASAKFDSDKDFRRVWMNFTRRRWLSGEDLSSLVRCWSELLFRAIIVGRLASLSENDDIPMRLAYSYRRFNKNISIKYWSLNIVFKIKSICIVGSTVCSAISSSILDASMSVVFIKAAVNAPPATDESTARTRWHISRGVLRLPNSSTWWLKSVGCGGCERPACSDYLSAFRKLGRRVIHSWVDLFRKHIGGVVSDYACIHRWLIGSLHPEH